jgi:hypothetical protein
VPVRVCLVGFRDVHGVLHAVQVEAASLFEAVARGLAILRGHPTVSVSLDRSTVLEVLAVPGGWVGRVRVDRLLRWLDSAGKSSKDQVLQYQLKRLLTGEPSGRPRRERYH